MPTEFPNYGAPTGMQIIAKTYDDLSVFRAAVVFEAVQP
jgi:Asp-tRNA(Asn)/Glu-tRNA(Gln) amidotransferase A subunit family amidase